MSGGASSRNWSLAGGMVGSLAGTAVLVLFLSRLEPSQRSDWADVIALFGSLYALAFTPYLALRTAAVGDAATLPRPHPPGVRRSAPRRRRPWSGERRAAAAVAALAVTATCVGGYAAVQTLRLEQSGDAVQADRLALHAIELGATRPDLAQLVAAEAFLRGPGRTTEAAAMRALSLPLHDSVTVPAHGGGATAVAVSPGDRYVATGGADGTIKLWDARDRSGLTVLRGHDGPVLDLAFGEGGAVLASAGRDRTVRRWDVAAGTAVGAPLLGHTDAVRAVRYLPSGRLLSGGADGTIRSWRPDGGPAGDAVVAQQGQGVESIAVSPDGTRFVTGGSRGMVRLWNARSTKLVAEFGTGYWSAVTAAAVSRDGRFVATASADRRVDVWDARTLARARLPLRGHTAPVQDLDFSPDSAYLISAGADGTVRRWAIGADLPEADTLTGGGGPVSGARYVGDGTIAAVSQDGTLRWWSTEARRSLGAVLPGSRGAGLDSVAFSPDGLTVAAGDGSGAVRWWDTRTQRSLGDPLRVAQGSVTGVAFDARGAVLLTAGADGAVRLWDAHTRRPAGELVPVGTRPKVWGLAVSRTGLVVTASSDGVVRLWDLAGGRMLGELRGHEAAAQGVAFSPDGRRLASTGDDGTLRLWDTDRLAARGVPRTGHAGAVWGVAFSTTGDLIATAGEDGTVRLWDGVTGAPAPRPVLRGHTAGSDGVAFTDGGLLASTSGDRQVRLWDLAERRSLGEPLSGHENWVDGVAVAGGTMATTSDDGTVRLWAVDRGEWVAQLCLRAGRNMSAAEWREHVGADTRYRATCPDLPADG